MAALDEDLRPPFPTEEEDPYGAAEPYALELHIEQRVQLQMLRVLRRLLVQPSPNGDQQRNGGNADCNPTANGVGMTEATVKLELTEKPLSATPCIVESANPLAEFVHRHVAQATSNYRVFWRWLHGRIAAAGGETVNGGGKA